MANIGHCGYVFGPLLIFTLFQPLVCYYTLLSDSKWWQGLGGGDDNNCAPGSINSPMWGMDLTLHSAQTLARTLDEMRNAGSAKLVNFAHINLDTHNIIGQGSFSRVYTGTYRMQKCAIKLVYSLDLTADEINKVAAEATLLNNVKHKHVVHIYGVSVLPPSVCILLELCAYGSLSDVLRGSTHDINKALTLSYLDKMYLAVGCARGLAALHSMGDSLVHRDIKSFNFLVDAQLNAKLADLELGMDSEDIDIDPESLLPNWAAPEVLLGQPYTQASDVYSLSLVLWEIVSGIIPYSDVKLSGIDMFNYIRNQSADLKVRMKIPNGFKDIGLVIEDGWHSDCAQRPTANQMVDRLTEIWCAASNDKSITNLLCEVYEERISGAEEKDSEIDQHTVIGQSISQLLQTWYTSAEYKKHVQILSSCNLIPAGQGAIIPDLSDTPSSVGITLTTQRQGRKVFVKEYSTRKRPISESNSVKMPTNIDEMDCPQLQGLYDAIYEHPDWRSLKTNSQQPTLIITKVISLRHCIFKLELTLCILSFFLVPPSYNNVCFRIVVSTDGL